MLVWVKKTTFLIEHFGTNSLIGTPKKYISTRDSTLRQVAMEQVCMTFDNFPKLWKCKPRLNWIEFWKNTKMLEMLKLFFCQKIKKGASIQYWHCDKAMFCFCGKMKQYHVESHLPLLLTCFHTQKLTSLQYQFQV